MRKKQNTGSKGIEKIFLTRVSYGKPTTPTKDREYQYEGEGAVGTQKEWKQVFKDRFPNRKFEFRFVERNKKKMKDVS